MADTDFKRVFLTALIWIGVASAAFILWEIRMALVVAFAAILLTILLRAVGGILSRLLHVPDAIGLTLSALVLLFIVMATVWLFGSRAISDFSAFMQHIRLGERRLSDYLRANGFGGLAVSMGNPSAKLLTNGISSFFPRVLAFVEYAVVIVVSGIYLAVTPRLYRIGLARLFGPELDTQIEQKLKLIGTSLELWLVGQLITMLIVGMLSFLAVWFIGLPSPLALGLIAGVTEVVPYVGPFVGAVPALLLGVTKGFEPMLWTAAAYLMIHAIEGYGLAPLLSRHFVRIPPALTLIGIVVAGLLFGVFGVVVGAPLTVAAYTAVKIFYVHDALNEPVDLPKRSPF